MLPTCQILIGDSAEVLQTLLDASVQCCVTSPPYDNLRTYGGHTWDFEAIAWQLYRVLCDGGVCCWNVGDATVNGCESLTSFKQAIFFVEQCGFRLHDTMIWQKSNFANPSFNRYHQLFEYVFIFSKGPPRIFNPIKDKQNKTAGCAAFGENTYARRDGERHVRDSHISAQFGMRGNVWNGNTRGQEEVCQALPHPAMMPKWLARDLILSWSNPGDTIIDPFSGSGTSGAAALENGRNAILIDIEVSYRPLMENSTAITLGMNL